MIQVQRVALVSAVSRERAAAGKRSQPAASWKLSPRHQISSAPVEAASIDRSESVAIESYGGNICPSLANQLAFSRWRSATSNARRAGQNNAPCGSAISSCPENEKRT